ncbi:flagellar protein FlgN [uncultured Bartonella sp.]|uniref:flagellar protein FlgN n=1 Tax=uncultured Bartonella sp. TaxID=104108 RepID=UPI00260B460A|nr:flagellar protein FlgN [uncultured Bartonella sp.]
MSLEEQPNEQSQALTVEKKPIDDPAARDIALTRLAAVVNSLEEVVDYETGALERNENPDYNHINFRKTRGLRDLNQSMSEVARYFDNVVETKVETLLGGLKKKLERNSELLKIHLEAVGELSDMMQEAARERETDGTYDPFSINNGQQK